MLSNNVFYHGTIRKAIVTFGSLFSNLYIDRKVDDSVEGTTVQRLHVPFAYAPKEKWLVRLEQDPKLTNHTYISLPRISFEIIGYNYDSNRKLPKMNQIVCNEGGTGNSSKTVYTPVPYNIDLAVYVITKTQEDAMQIIEQILPTFAPEYTLSIMALPEMNIVQDIPVLLNSVGVQDDFDGNFELRRFVVHTLTFTMKLNLYGPVTETESKPIYYTFVDLTTNEDLSNPLQQHQSEGDPVTYEIIKDEWIYF